MSDEITMIEGIDKKKSPASNGELTEEFIDFPLKSQEILEKRQLKWRCRRGMLELDLMLQPFVDYAYDTLSSSMKVKFIELLAESDQQLQRWLLGNEIPSDPKVHDLVLVIRYYAHRRS